MKTRRQFETLCGCHVADRQIVYCRYHGKVQAMATLLDLLRRYFLEKTGEQSPFVQKIDDLLPRHTLPPPT